MVALVGGTALIGMAVLGGTAGLGVMIAMGAFAPSRSLGARRRRPLPRVTSAHVLTVAASLGAGILILVATRWPVAGLAAAGAVAAGPVAIRRRGSAAREIAKVEAIATWTEQLRDNLAAAGGLQSALGAAAEAAPLPIAGPVERLAARLEYERLSTALRKFGAEVDHPAVDFVVAALVISTEHRSRHLGPLLGRLAATARDEATLRRRIWVSRARARTSMKVVAAIVPTMLGALVLLDRRYLSAYDTVGGQVALAVVLGVFLAAFMVMGRMSRIEMPARFMTRSDRGDAS